MGSQHCRGHPWPGLTPVGTQALALQPSAPLGVAAPLTGHGKVRSLSHTGSLALLCALRVWLSSAQPAPAKPQHVRCPLSDRGPRTLAAGGVLPGPGNENANLRQDKWPQPSRQQGPPGTPCALTLHQGRRVGTHLERDPQGVDLGRFLRQRRRLGPDVREPDAASGETEQGGRERAAILVACHDEEIHDEGGEEQQEQDARQGEPVHLPAGRRRARWGGRKLPPPNTLLCLQRGGPPANPPGTQ